jgi:hypothetical protein
LVGQALPFSQLTDRALSAILTLGEGKVGTLIYTLPSCYPLCATCIVGKVDVSDICCGSNRQDSQRLTLKAGCSRRRLLRDCTDGTVLIRLAALCIAPFRSNSVPPNTSEIHLTLGWYTNPLRFQHPRPRSSLIQYMKDTATKMTPSPSSSNARRYSPDELLYLRSFLPEVSCVVNKLNTHPDIGMVFKHQVSGRQ